jgi:hypothetical protein
MKQPESLESFYPLLAKDIEVQEKLTSQFAGRAPSILQQMEAGSGLGGDADTVSDLLEELVKDECGEVSSWPRMTTRENALMLPGKSFLCLLPST